MSRAADPLAAMPDLESAEQGAPLVQEFIMPFEKGRVTSMFNQGRRHPAIDLAGPLGSPVYSTTRKQRVTFAGRQGGYGNLVITRDSQGRQHYYGHLQRTLARVGAMLEQGDLLGLLGSTGRSTGPHVHYEVRKPRGGHLDPSKLLFSGRVGRGYAWNTPRPEGSRLASRSGQPRPAVGRHALVGQPHASGRRAGLPEHVDRHAAARIPVAADAQVVRLQQRRQPLADRHRAVLVERAVVAERGEVQLQRLGFDQPRLRHVVDDEVREVRLARDGAERR